MKPGPDLLGTGGAGGAELCNCDGRNQVAKECCVLEAQPPRRGDNYTCACAVSGPHNVNRPFDPQGRSMHRLSSVVHPLPVFAAR